MLSKLTKHEYTLNTEHETMLPKRSEAKTQNWFNWTPNRKKVWFSLSCRRTFSILVNHTSLYSSSTSIRITKIMCFTSTTESDGQIYADTYPHLSMARPVTTRKAEAFHLMCKFVVISVSKIICIKTWLQIRIEV